MIAMKDLPGCRDLDRAAMRAVRGGTSGSWVVGWIAPFPGGSASAGQHGARGDAYHITNNFFTQIINAGQATFQTQNTDVFNSAANAVIGVGPGQASASFRG